MAHDCSPPYVYRPTFIAGTTPSTIPSYTETRSRIFAGGTFFRSKGVGTDKNTIEVETIESGTDFTLNVYKGGTLEETFGPVTQTFVPETTEPPVPEHCDPNAIDGIRSLVNASSLFIEMPTLDYGGQPTGGGGSPTFTAATDDAVCMTPFVRSFLSGATGGPTDGSGIGAIRTGPERTLIAIQETELINNDITDDGQTRLPTLARRVQQWDGSAWIEYDPSNICV